MKTKNALYCCDTMMHSIIERYGHREKESRRYAIFDYDHTIVKPCDGRQFSKAIDDWQFLRPSVPGVIRQYAKKHHIVIATDQSKPWKVDQIREVISELKLQKGTDLTLIVGTKEDNTKKPSRKLFYRAFPHLKATDWKDKSFYVGDAAGRIGDWSDVDRVYAEKLGVTFHVPEDLFPLSSSPRKTVQAAAAQGQEVVIMVGYPASGKTTIAEELVTINDGSLFPYYRVDGDMLKTPAKMLLSATKEVRKHKSIIFDATNSSKAKRQAYVEFANDHSLPVRCIWIAFDMERNKERDKHVPPVAFYIYRKHFEEPDEEEGFELLKIGGDSENDAIELNN